MKIRSCAVFVTVALCTSLLTRLDAQTSQEGLTVAVNGRTFSAGRTMVVTAKLTPLAIPQAVDAYVVVQLPTGQYLSLQLGGSLVPGIVPIARGFVPFSYEAPLVQYTFSGGEPAGAYTWYVGLARPGTLDLIAPVQQVEFTFSTSTPETSAHTAIGLTTPSPSSVPVGSLTVVTVTSQLKDPQVVPSSVTLEHLIPLER